MYVQKQELYDLCMYKNRNYMIYVCTKIRKNGENDENRNYVCTKIVDKLPNYVCTKIIFSRIMYIQKYKKRLFQ